MGPLNLLRQAALCVGAGGMVASAMAGKIPAAKFASVAARVELRDNAAVAGPVTTAPPLKVPAPATLPSVPSTVAPVGAVPVVIVASEGATVPPSSTEALASTTIVALSPAAGSAAAGSAAAGSAAAGSAGAGSPAAPAASVAPVPPTTAAPTTVPSTSVPRPRAADPAPAYPIAPGMEGGSTFVVGG